MTTVYRWQDDEGRGPYRPGFSRAWVDPLHEIKNPAMFTEFGVGVVGKALPGEGLGCAFRTVEQMKAWFSEGEQERLRFFGYTFVALEADRIVAESERQLVFARRKPFRFGATPVEVPA
ncbi:hypothetical protein [Hydrogenophaga sp.]|uniref:hypothetical protein n=1 Tax=Hydrogenophaga sp. TaxID=1904254 RepID=UPI003F6E8152